MLLWNCW